MSHENLECSWFLQFWSCSCCYLQWLIKKRNTLACMQAQTWALCWSAGLCSASWPQSPPAGCRSGPPSSGRRWTPGCWPARCPAGGASSQPGRETAGSAGCKSGKEENLKTFEQQNLMYGMRINNMCDHEKDYWIFLQKIARKRHFFQFSLIITNASVLKCFMEKIVSKL